jgi:hypothetical protein
MELLVANTIKNKSLEVQMNSMLRELESFEFPKDQK